jgi:HEAT repeat protein
VAAASVLCLCLGGAVWAQAAQPVAGKGLAEIAELERRVWDEKPAPHGAVQALGTMGEAAVPALIKMMRGHPGGDIRWLSQEALAKIGQPAVEPMKAVLKDGDAGAKMAAVLGLEKVLGNAAVPVLRPLLQDPSQSVVARAAGALLRITGDSDTYLPPLVGTLKAGSDGDRWVAAESLGWCGPKAAGAAKDLAAALRTTQGSTRQQVLVALEKMGTQEAKEALAMETVDGLKGGDVWTRLQSAKVLGQAGAASRTALDALRERLGDVNEDILVRGYCAWAIDQIDPAGRPAAPRTFYVNQQAPNAADANPGTAAAPWKTVQRAAEEMTAGDTVLIGSGVYRELVRPFRGGESYERLITYRAAPGADVVIKGSDVWAPTWEQADIGGTKAWAAPWQRLEWDQPEKWPSPRSGPMHRAEQVFVDGVQLTQVATREDLAKTMGVFYTDDTEGKLYVRLPQDVAPAGRLIERSLRQQIFAPAVRGLGYIRVQGLQMMHAANPESNGANWGVIGHRAAFSTRAGHHWIIEGNTVNWANAQGMDVGGEGWSDDLKQQPPVSSECGWHQIRRNQVSHNGVAGIVGWSGANYLLLEDNVTNYNCLKGNFYAYEAAGVKLHGTDHVIIRRHRAHGNEAFGIWTDYLCHHTRISQCTLTENRGAGIFVEVSSQGPNLVDSNVVIGTRDATNGNWGDGLYSHDADDVTWANNLVLNCAGWGVRITRCLGRTAGWGVTSDNRHRVCNNIIAGNRRGAINFRPEEPYSRDNRSDLNVLWGHEGPPVGTVENGGIDVKWADTEAGRRLGLKGTASLTLPFPRWQEYGQDRGSITLPPGLLLPRVTDPVPPDQPAEPLVQALAGLWQQDFTLSDGVGDYKPRPPGEIVSALCAELADAQFRRQIMLSPTVGVQVWEKAGAPLLAAWDWGPGTEVALPGVAAGVKVAGQPVFCTSTAQVLLGEPALSVPTESVAAGIGEPTAIEVGAGLRAAAVAALRCRVEGTRLVVRPEPGAAAGRYQVILADETAWGMVSLTVAEPLTIESIVSATDAPDACLVRVRNHLTRPLTCAVELRVEERTETQTVTLPAAGVGEARFRLPAGTGWVQAHGCARLEGGASASADALLSTVRSPHTKTALASDGRPEDWQGLPRYRIDGFPDGFFPESLRQAVAEKPGDLSAQFASQWDEQALYLRVEVTDDVHRQAQEDGKAWQQDSVQVLVETPPGPGERTRLELDFDLPSATGARPRVVGRRSPGVEILSPEAVAGVRLTVLREAPQTVYTAAIPWSALGLAQPPPSRSRLGLALVVNDDDEDGRGRHGLQWFFGIHGYRGQYERLGSLWLE